MVRKQTTAMSETDFKIRGNICRFIDVGGQIKYRSRWHMFFDDAKAIFFIVSMASYDQMMEEDVKKNRMADSMELFSSTINNPLLRNVAVMLFLNKTDLVEKKLAYSSLRKHFIDLSCKSPLWLIRETALFIHQISPVAKKNETDIENAKSYFKYKFEILNANKTRRLYTSFTNSTDSRLMEKVINGIL